MSAYYNENDPYAAEWLRQLIKVGVIPDGVVDERSIVEVQSRDLRGFGQCHFFAGIGGWSYALRLSGWPNDKPVWTGSCPCQPFSNAGNKEGINDKRHLWPEFHRLIRESGPSVVFGEQVASKLGRSWLAGVQTDLEALDFAFGAADLCAAGVGAPHVRQRLFWVAEGLADADHGYTGNTRDTGGTKGQRVQSGYDVDRRGFPGRVPDAGTPRSPVSECEEFRGPGRREEGGATAELCGPQNGWGDAIYVPCADGKARRIKPGLEPLAYGIPGRVGLLRGYGNAIVPQVAAAFIQAYLEVKGETHAR